VLHTEAVSIDAPTYVPVFGSRLLAGPGSEHPISDHAALTFTVGLSSRVPEESTQAAAGLIKITAAASGSRAVAALR